MIHDEVGGGERRPGGGGGRIVGGDFETNELLNKVNVGKLEIIFTQLS